MDPAQGANFTPAIITATTAFGIWIFGQLAGFISKRRDSKAQNDAILKALYAEVHFNKTKLDTFVSATSPEVLNTILDKVKENKELIPHIAETKHIMIYEKNISYIHVFDSRSIEMIIDFYGNMQRIKSIVEGMYLPSFKSISDEGRSNVVRNIFVACDQTCQSGRVLLRYLEDKYKIPASKITGRAEKPSKFQKDYLDGIPDRKARLDKDLEEFKRSREVR